MKRKLIQQMRNEWRSNLWMGIELVIVGFVLWAIFTFSGFMSYLHKEPVGFDLTDIYIGEIRSIPEEATTYTPYPDSLHSDRTDLESLMNHLRNNPYVEIIGTGINAIPYNFNFSGNEMSANIDGQRQIYYGNVRMMSPDLIRAIHLQGINGETSEELATMIDNGQILLSTYEATHNEIQADPTIWRGRDIFWSYDSTRVEHVGAVINGIRRSDYEPSFGVIVTNLTNRWLPDELVIRVKPGKGRDFLASVKGSDLEFGNVYVSNLQSSEQRRDQAHLTIKSNRDAMIVSAAFVMVAVFLGFLGSFWYKTQQRVPELALRKVNGATSASLFRRLISEGMILLAVAGAIIAVLGGFILSRIDLAAEIGMSFPAWIPWAMFAVALAALALMIVAGIALPASKAMKINPAQALKDQ